MQDIALILIITINLLDYIILQFNIRNLNITSITPALLQIQYKAQAFKYFTKHCASSSGLRDTTDRTVQSQRVLLTHSLPQSTLVDLTFQSRALRSFSLNQLRNLSLEAGNLHSSFSISSLHYLYPFYSSVCLHCDIMNPCLSLCLEGEWAV